MHSERWKLALYFGYFFSSGQEAPRFTSIESGRADDRKRKKNHFSKGNKLQCNSLVSPEKKTRVPIVSEKNLFK